MQQIHKMSMPFLLPLLPVSLDFWTHIFDSFLARCCFKNWFLATWLFSLYPHSSVNKSNLYPAILSEIFLNVSQSLNVAHLCLIRFNKFVESSVFPCGFRCGVKGSKILSVTVYRINIAMLTDTKHVIDFLNKIDSRPNNLDLSISLLKISSYLKAITPP